MEEIKELCEQISKYLQEKQDPHTTIIITDNYIKMVRDEVGIPVELEE